MKKEYLIQVSPESTSVQQSICEWLFNGACQGKLPRLHPSFSSGKVFIKKIVNFMTIPSSFIISTLTVLDFVERENYREQLILARRNSNALKI